MAFPLIVPAATAAAAYVKGRWFSDDDSDDKSNLFLTAGKVGLMAIGSYAIYRVVKKQIKEVTK